jgi:pyruvate/2-oxoglutarate dehydrogenase complex dihydrolipoamide dehydrogenase (E3) component
MNTEYYDDIVIGGDKAGKTLTPALAASGRKTALVERSLIMIGVGASASPVFPLETMLMQAKLPYTVLRDGVLAHPTMTEGLNLLFSKL